jgi:pyruvate kinase
MESAKSKLFQRLATGLDELLTDMLGSEALLLSDSRALHKNHVRSARNLAHYLVLRQHDLRELQTDLAELGLSSLGRSESHVLSAVQAVYHALSALTGSEDKLRPLATPPISLGEGSELLNRNTAALLGRKPSGRMVRIMVTMSTEASVDYELVRDLVRSGMNCMRINCAHDSPEVWLGMIGNLKRARTETGLPCCIEMDLAGPKLRTGPIEPGPAVIRFRPQRDKLGRVIKPARIWLSSIEKHNAPPAEAGTPILVSDLFLSRLRRGDSIHFHDARDAHRCLRVVKRESQGCWAELHHTAYLIPGIELRAAAGRISATGKPKRWKGRVGPIPSTAQTLLLKQGETLILNRSMQPGKPAVRDKQGKVISPPQIGVTLLEFFQDAKPGESIWFDDGKIGGIIGSIHRTNVHVRITQARPEGENLGEGKGINLPDTRLRVPALSPEDLQHLKFIAEHADLVGFSFVRTETDVQQLVEEIHKLKKDSLGLVLKIETRGAFANLPRLVLAAMTMRAVGVMIARGDLAVECGYQRLAEVQEEILWICEAAHIPVIWATQVLESLSKTGIPSRSEITDAAMGERAECVMLNKGPYIVSAVRALDDILKRMQAHQEKKTSMLRRLRIADAFASAGHASSAHKPMGSDPNEVASTKPRS